MLTGYAPSGALVYRAWEASWRSSSGRRALPPYVCVPNAPTPSLARATSPPASPPSPWARTPPTVATACGTSRSRSRTWTRAATRAAGTARGGGRALRGGGPRGRRARRDERLLRARLRAAGLPRGPRGLRRRCRAGKMRDRYGRSQAGQRLLLARRLVAAGARYVTVGIGGWDHHQQIERGLRRQVPAVDQAFAALISDLRATACSTRSSCWSPPSSAARPRSTPTRAAITGRRLLHRDGGRGHQGGPRPRRDRRDGHGGRGGRRAAGGPVAHRLPLLGIDPDAELAAGNRPIRLVKAASSSRGSSRDSEAGLARRAPPSEGAPAARARLAARRGGHAQVVTLERIAPRGAQRDERRALPRGQGVERRGEPRVRPRRHGASVPRRQGPRTCRRPSQRTRPRAPRDPRADAAGALGAARVPRGPLARGRRGGAERGHGEREAIRLGCTVEGR